MKIGVKKIELVELSAVADFSYFSPGSSIAIDQFITGARTSIYFTPGTGTFEETWLEDTGGLLSEVIVSVTNRQQKDKVDNELTKWQFFNMIAIVTLMDDRVKIIGSKSFPAKMTLSNTIYGFDSSDKSCEINCRSPHGSFTAK